MTAPKNRTPLKLEDDRMCFACGSSNPIGFRLKFRFGKDGKLHTQTRIKKEFQGYKNIAHGGIVTLLLDETMVNVCWLQGLKAVTAEMTVRLKKPIRVGERISIEASIQQQKGRVLNTVAQAFNSRREVVAEASAVCIRPKKVV